MRRYIVASITSLTIVSAFSSAFAKDPCQSLICMMGKVQGGVTGNGSNQDGCAPGIQDFLSIVKKHNGHLDLTATPKARRDYLNSCRGAATDSSSVDSIISNFGNATL